MHAIISLLDETLSRQVELLWDELRRRFGVTSGIIARYPHISYFAAKSIDSGIANDLLRPIASATTPMTVFTGGLCLFTTKTPVIHIPVARTAELSALHQKIWDACSNCAESPSTPFAPPTWMPHITLAQDGIEQNNLGDVIAWLAGLDLRWEIPIDNLALIDSDGNKQSFDFSLIRHAGHAPTQA